MNYTRVVQQESIVQSLKKSILLHGVKICIYYTIYIYIALIV